MDNLCSYCHTKETKPGYKLCPECLQKRNKRRVYVKPTMEHPWNEARRFAANYKKGEPDNE